MHKPTFVALIVLAAIAASPLDAQKTEFDLLIKGGHVIDPRNGVNAVTDVAVSGGKVALLAGNIARERARDVADAAGFYVTPGLIDIHAHVFWGHDEESQYSDGYSAVQPDSHSFRSGQTTLVDVGGAGWRSFPKFKEQVIDRSQTRVLSFLNIAGSGMRGGPVEQNLSDMDAKLTAMRIRQHPGVIVSITSAMMSPGDEKIVAQRVVAILSAKHTLTPADATVPPITNLSGRWEVEIQYAASRGTHTLHLQQNGNRLDGTHQGNFLGRDIAGTMNGDHVTLSSVVTERHGDALTYRFSGKLTGDTLSGSLDMGEYLAATWTARRSGRV